MLMTAGITLIFVNGHNDSKKIKNRLGIGLAFEFFKAHDAKIGPILIEVE
jgi:hypothetical protein